MICHLRCTNAPRDSFLCALLKIPKDIYASPAEFVHCFPHELAMKHEEILQKVDLPAILSTIEE